MLQFKDTYSEASVHLSYGDIFGKTIMHMALEDLV